MPHLYTRVSDSKHSPVTWLLAEFGRVAHHSLWRATSTSTEKAKNYPVNYDSLLSYVE